MAKKLAYSVTLWNTFLNDYETFMPGDSLPDWAVDQVRNPSAFQVEEPEPVFGRDLPVPGPSQHPFDEHAEFADKPRYMTKSNAIPLGQDLLGQEEFVVFAQPRLHDEVAATAGERGVAFSNPAANAIHDLRTGAAEQPVDAASREAWDKDVELAMQRQAEFYEQQLQALRAEFERQLAVEQGAFAMKVLQREAVEETADRLRGEQAGVEAAVAESADEGEVEAAPEAEKKPARRGRAASGDGENQ